MEHLSAETLARLADEQPASAEKGHLAGCQACSAELDALREQAEACRHLPDLRVPLGDWEALQARLVSEGLIGSRTSLTGGLAVTPGWMRALAALVLFLAGTGVGVGAARRETAAAAWRCDPCIICPVVDRMRTCSALSRYRFFERIT